MALPRVLIMAIGKTGSIISSAKISPSDISSVVVNPRPPSLRLASMGTLLKIFFSPPEEIAEMMRFSFRLISINELNGR